MMEKPASIPPGSSQAVVNTLQQTTDYMHLNKEERAFIGDVRMGFRAITEQLPNIAPKDLISQLKATITIIRAGRRAYDIRLLNDIFLASVLLSVDRRDNAKHNTVYLAIINQSLDKNPVGPELLSESPEDPNVGGFGFI